LALWEIACHAHGTKIDPHRARYFPLGLPILGVGDRVVRRVNSVLHFTRSSKLSNRTSPCSKPSIRGIRLHKLWQKSRASDYFNWRNGIPREHRSKTDRNVLSVRSRLRCRNGGPFLGHNFRIARHSGVIVGIDRSGRISGGAICPQCVIPRQRERFSFKQRRI
jgi:hypothetical protein